MKKLLLLILSILSIQLISAQIPSGFTYQAVLRNSSGQALANQVVSLRVSLSNSDGTVHHYSEEHSLTTTAQGVVSLVVGQGQDRVGQIESVPWSSQTIFIALEVKLTGANEYSFMGRQQLQAVPYALFATDGVAIEWLGTLTTPPLNPSKNQAYYNSIDKMSYIWDGDSWEILTVDGQQGLPGVGLTLRGSWSSIESYAVGDYVFDGSSSNVAVNSMWICQLAVGPTIVHPKDDLSHWVEFEAPAGPQGVNGISLQWLGSLPAAPTSPVFNQAYYNTNDKKSYIWDGDSWEILAKDGEPGPSGMIVPGTQGQMLVYTGTDWVATGKITVNADTLGVGIQTPISKMVVQGDATALPEDPIFEVKNKDGKVVFGVYNEGVRVYVADTGTKGAKGGFAVGGLSTQGKAGAVEYMRITPDSARIYIDTSDAKGAKGGFAVGGLSTQGKAIPYELFRVTKDSTRVYIADDAAKGAKGGFAVGGLSTQGKGSSYELLRVTKDSTRVYVNEGAKGAKGGFAVGGLSTQGKTTAPQFLNITPDNYFIGHESGKSVTSGLYNSFLGYQTGVLNSLGSSNSFMGYRAGYSNVDGSNNLFIGYQSGYSNSSGSYNSFLGYLA